MKIVKLTGVIGAELLDVDISRDLSSQKISDIRQALLENKVIFFRGQQLSPEQHIAFTEKFGEISRSPVYQILSTHPQIMPVVKEPKDKDVIGDTWHPEVGGDTLFADLYRAYDTLSEALQRQIGTLRAVHSNELLNASARNASRTTKLREDIGQIESVHPVVRIHEETGRKLLFVNQPFTMRFEGMTKGESQPLLQYLFTHASKPENTCRFRWQPGSLAFWDNRCTMHYAVNDYPGFRREMHRITIQGAEPR